MKAFFSQTSETLKNEEKEYELAAGPEFFA